MSWIERVRELAEKVKTALESVQNALAAMGKIVWVVIGVFVAIAVGTGHPALLGTLRDRLILAGVTSLKTPWGEIDPKLIGRMDALTRSLGVSAAIASDIAASTNDPKSKERLQEMAKSLKEQHSYQLETLNSLSERHRASAGTGPTANVQDVEGWLYVGRQSGGDWRPPSFSIGKPSYPVKAGDALIVNADALLYGSMDCRSIDAAEFKPNVATAQVILVKAGPAGVPVIDQATECPSAGGAKLVWAKVRVPPGRAVVQ